MSFHFGPCFGGPLNGQHLGSRKDRHELPEYKGWYDWNEEAWVWRGWET